MWCEHLPCQELTFHLEWIEKRYFDFDTFSKDMWNRVIARLSCAPIKMLHHIFFAPLTTLRAEWSAHTFAWMITSWIMKTRLANQREASKLRFVYLNHHGRKLATIDAVLFIRRSFLYLNKIGTKRCCFAITNSKW